MSIKSITGKGVIGTIKNQSDDLANKFLFESLHIDISILHVQADALRNEGQTS